MKRLSLSVLPWIFVVATGGSVRAQEAKAFYGEISDSQCAMNVHSLTRSHQEMLKSKSMGGTPRDCTLFCVNYHGGDFVLSSKKNVFHLDDQNLARGFAGKKVKIVGKMEADKKTIQILKIEEEEQ